jgi:hypothetical protein
MEKESDKEINYVDLIVIGKPTKFVLNIYRKPTFSSMVINSMTCHPIEHKLTAFNYFYNRVNQYPLQKYKKQIELNIIRQIASESDYKMMKPPKVQFTSGNTTLNTGAQKELGNIYICRKRKEIHN